MTASLVLSLVLLGACGLSEAWQSSPLRRARPSSRLRESSDSDWDRYYQDKHRATKVEQRMMMLSSSDPPQYQIIAAPSMENMARDIVNSDPSRFKFHSTKVGRLAANRNYHPLFFL